MFPGGEVTPEAIAAMSSVCWAPNALLAGTTGGSVEMLCMGDGQPRRTRSFIGQCACPVHSLAASSAMGGVVLASSNHDVNGTGHVQGCLAGDSIIIIHIRTLYIAAQTYSYNMRPCHFPSCGLVRNAHFVSAPLPDDRVNELCIRVRGRPPENGNVKTSLKKLEKNTVENNRDEAP